MDNMNQMINYKKESFWKRLKIKIAKLFAKKEKKKALVNEIETKKSENTEQEMSKEAFFDLYKKVKNYDVKIDKLDKNSAYKIMIMLNEELNMNDGIINEKKNSIDVSLNNLKIYKKELELYSKNS